MNRRKKSRSGCAKFLPNALDPSIVEAHACYEAILLALDRCWNEHIRYLPGLSALNLIHMSSSNVQNIFAPIVTDDAVNG
ncbi:hypothetical protein V6N13_099327 [Hibiscus sabdariffa]